MKKCTTICYVKSQNPSDCFSLSHLITLVNIVVVAPALHTEAGSPDVHCLVLLCGSHGKLAV